MTKLPRSRSRHLLVQRSLAYLAVAALSLSAVRHARAGVTSLDAALGDHDTAIYGFLDDGAPLSTSGYTVTGDVNADGHVDLIIGLSGAAINGDFSGAVWILHGPFSDGDLDLADRGIDVVLVGASESDFFGNSLTVRDVNGDEIDDVVITAAGAGVGQLYIFFGGALPARWDLSVTPADVTVSGTFDLLIHAVVGGDIDHDGFYDLLIMASNRAIEPTSGVLYGRTDWPATIELVSSAFDTALLGHACGWGGNRNAQIYDVDGDGNNDLVTSGRRLGLTVPPESGEIAVRFGDGGRFPPVLDYATDPPDLLIQGPHEEAWLGRETFAVGDLNGDDLGDFAIRARATPSGLPAQVYVLLGRSDLTSPVDLSTTHDALARADPEELSGFGRSLSIADFDGDGYDDLAASDYQAGFLGRGSRVGRLHLWFGSSDPSSIFDVGGRARSLRLWGADDNDRLTVDDHFVFQDLDGDGLADLALQSNRGQGPDNVYAPGWVGETLLLRGCEWEFCCDLWRDNALTAIDPLSRPKADLLPLDADDCYRWRHVGGAPDPETTILTDVSRPLIFYAVQADSNALQLTTDSSGRVLVHH